MNNHNLLDALIEQAKLSKKTTDKQQRIIEAAITLFAEKGYANTSTNEIAKKAGVAEGTIFRHYGTKDNLLLSVILPFLKQSLPSMADEVFTRLLADEPKFEDFLRMLITDRLAFFKQNRDVFHILVKEILYNEQLRSMIAPIFVDTVIKHLHIAIQKFQQRGELIDWPSKTVLRMVMTNLAGYFLVRIFIEPESLVEDEQEEIDRIVHYIIHGVGSN